MNNGDSFIKQLGFDNIKPVSDELKPLGVDSVHSSGEFPAVFFKKVERFGIQELQTSKTNHLYLN